MDIKKIKIDRSDNKDKIFIEWTNFGDEYTLKCKDAPRHELLSAISDMAPYWQEILELEEIKDMEPNVSSISFTSALGENGSSVMGVTIYASMKLTKGTGVWGANSPHRIERFYSDSGGDSGQLMSDDLIDACKVLLSEAKRYINGERAQMSLLEMKAA